MVIFLKIKDGGGRHLGIDFRPYLETVMKELLYCWILLSKNSIDVQNTV